VDTVKQVLEGIESVVATKLEEPITAHHSTEPEVHQDPNQPLPYLPRANHQTQSAGTPGGGEGGGGGGGGRGGGELGRHVESSTKAVVRAMHERASCSPASLEDSDCGDGVLAAGGNEEEGVVLYSVSHGSGVVDEENAESVRAQVSLIESLFANTSNSLEATACLAASGVAASVTANAVSIPSNTLTVTATSNAGPSITSATADAQPLNSGANEQNPDVSIRSIDQASGNLEACSSLTTTSAQENNAAAIADIGMRHKVPAVSGEGKKQGKGSGDGSVTLRGCPLFDETDVPEMEEVYPNVREACALYAYQAQEDDELELREGEIVYVLGLSQPEWYVVVRAAADAAANSGKADIGLVPHNYVKMSDNSSDSVSGSSVAEKRDLWFQFATDSEELSPHPSPLAAFAAPPASSPPVIPPAAAEEAHDQAWKEFEEENVGGDGKKKEDEEDTTNESWVDSPIGPAIFSRSATRAFTAEELDASRADSTPLSSRGGKEEVGGRECADDAGNGDASEQGERATKDALDASFDADSVTASVAGRAHMHTRVYTCARVRANTDTNTYVCIHTT